MNRVDNVFYWLPCAVVFVSTAHEDKRDIMTANAMFVSEKEPLLVISVAQGHLTDQLISQSGKFTLVIAGEDQKKLAAQAGSSKGEQADKFEQFSIKTINSGENEAALAFAEHALDQDGNSIGGKALRAVANVWAGYDDKGDRKLVRGLISRLRAKVETDPHHPEFILTIPGAGYTFGIDNGE